MLIDSRKFRSAAKDSSSFSSAGSFVVKNLCAASGNIAAGLVIGTTIGINISDVDECPPKIKTYKSIAEVAKSVDIKVMNSAIGASGKITLKNTAIQVNMSTSRMVIIWLPPHQIISDGH